MTSLALARLGPTTTGAVVSPAVDVLVVDTAIIGEAERRGRHDA
jgi:hypothetical protein